MLYHFFNFELGHPVQIFLIILQCNVKRCENEADNSYGPMELLQRDYVTFNKQNGAPYHHHHVVARTLLAL